MRERLTALLLGLGAVLLSATLFVGGEAASGSGSVPTTVDAADNGLLGAVSWLRGQGVRTLALRERFDTLAKRRDLPGEGNLLIVSLPGTVAFRREELLALDDWIRAGNTLLVLAALDDRPGWARTDASLPGELEFLTGLDTRSAGEHAARQGATNEPRDPLQRLARSAHLLGEPHRGVLLPARPHAFFTAVQSAHALSDYPPRGWRLRLPRDEFVLTLAREQGSGEDVFWVRTEGAGSIAVSGFASLFSNRLLGEADNARLLGNIVASTVTPGGAVLFDDQHQGLGLAYDPARFYRDPRLYATLGVIALVWLAWVLGSTRLRLPPARAPVPREADLVRVTGLFLARVLRPEAAARLMFAQFFRALPGNHAQESLAARELWVWLENHPQVPRADLDQLRAWHERAEAGQRVPLGSLHNLILKTERRLAL